MAIEATQIPGSVATFVTCSKTLWSIARTSGSLAKRIPGTRIFPRGSIHHSCSERRFRRERSTVVLRSDVHDALGDPRAALAGDAEAGPGGPLHLDGGVVPVHRHRLAEGTTGEPRAL